MHTLISFAIVIMVVRVIGRRLGDVTIKLWPEPEEVVIEKT